MSTAARRRLMRDFRRIQANPPAGICACPKDDNIMIWKAVIFGPDDTIWEAGTFKLTMVSCMFYLFLLHLMKKQEFTEEYPNKPPKVMFVTSMFHPNSKAFLSAPRHNVFDGSF